MAREFKVSVALPDGSASAPALTFSGDTDTGLFRTGTTISFVANGFTMLDVYPTGILVQDTITAGGNVTAGGRVSGASVVYTMSTRQTSMQDLEVMGWMS